MPNRDLGHLFPGFISCIYVYFMLNVYAISTLNYPITGCSKLFGWSNSPQWILDKRMSYTNQKIF